MEAGLAERLAERPLPVPRPAVAATPPPAVAPPTVNTREAPRTSEAVIPATMPQAVEPVEWPDDAAESAFLAEARDRGEPVKATPAAIEKADEAVDPKALPKLEDLVERIPADVRETLDSLFRVKFVRVQRVRKRDLKSEK